MGKASRRKKEKKLGAIQSHGPRPFDVSLLKKPNLLESLGTRLIFTPQLVISQHPQFSGPVYRFCNDEALAKGMEAGAVPLSTIAYIKGLENGAATDRRELEYSSDVYSATLQPGTPQAAVAAQFGIKVAGNGSVGIENIRFEAHYPNAFILCTTLDFDGMFKDGRFGKFCVEIPDPEKYYSAITRHLEAHASVNSGTAMAVNYAERDGKNFEGTVSEIGFTKPTRFSPENEFRFLWTSTDESKIERKIWEIPETIGLCKRIR